MSARVVNPLLLLLFLFHSIQMKTIILIIIITTLCFASTFNIPNFYYLNIFKWMEWKYYYIFSLQFCVSVFVFICWLWFSTLSIQREALNLTILHVLCCIQLLQFGHWITLKKWFWLLFLFFWVEWFEFWQKLFR